MKRIVAHIRIMLPAAVLASLACLQLGLPQIHAQSAVDSDSSAIKQRIAELSDAFNHHDAHAFATQFADDVDFTNLPGVLTHGLKALEDRLTPMFSGVLKDAQRTETIKRIRFLTPEIASVDSDWEMAAIHMPDGSERSEKGLSAMIMTKQNDKWLITVFHEQMLSQVQTQPPDRH